MTNKTATNEKTTRTKQLKGTVVSDKMDKTVVVQVERYVKHPKYGKYFRMRKNFKAHDERNHFAIGDTVEIVETAPISKDKSFKVVYDTETNVAAK